MRPNGDTQRASSSAGASEVKVLPGVLDGWRTTLRLYAANPLAAKALLGGAVAFALAGLGVALVPSLHHGHGTRGDFLGLPHLFMAPQSHFGQAQRLAADGDPESAAALFADQQDSLTTGREAVQPRSTASEGGADETPGASADAAGTIAAESASSTDSNTTAQSDAGSATGEASASDGAAAGDGAEAGAASADSGGSRLGLGADTADNAGGEVATFSPSQGTGPNGTGAIAPVVAAIAPAPTAGSAPGGTATNPTSSSPTTPGQIFMPTDPTITDPVSSSPSGTGSAGNTGGGSTSGGGTGGSGNPPINQEGDPQSVPEPGTLPLLGALAGSFLLLRRRPSRQASLPRQASA